MINDSWTCQTIESTRSYGYRSRSFFVPGTGCQALSQECQAVSGLRDFLSLCLLLVQVPGTWLQRWH